MSMPDSWTFPDNLLIKIPPLHYYHILNNNTNVVRLEVGPQTLCCKDEEKPVLGPTKMVVVPPKHYITLINPVITKKGSNGEREVLFDKSGQALLSHGQKEVRLEQDPFPLYPGEIIDGKVEQIPIIQSGTAFRLKANCDFVDRFAQDEEGRGIKRYAGEEWYCYGPTVYIPQPEVQKVGVTKSTTVKPGQALRLKALRDFTDRTGEKRKAGEEWHYSYAGAYLPALEETILKTEDPYIINDKTALHIRSKTTHTDIFGIERIAGSEWLVTSSMAVSYIPHVLEQYVLTQSIISLTKRQYMIIGNPVDEQGRPQYGKEKLIKGEKHFFLQPGETKLKIPTDVVVLTAEEGLWVTAKETFTEPGGKRRIAGEKWFITGPKEYWPLLEVEPNNYKAVPDINVGSVKIYTHQIATFLQCLGAAFLLLIVYVLSRVLLE